MSNTLYANARELFLTAQLNWTTQTFGVLLCTNGYTPNVASDQYVTDVPGVAISARAALASLSGSAGGAHAANVVVSGVTGSAIAYLVIYRNTGSDATSPLVCLIDTGIGLPAFPSGTDITISWDATHGIFIV